MKTPSRDKKVLVMGVGNTLLQDDGVGIHITDILRNSESGPTNNAESNVEYIDGGTIGLALLPKVEDAHALIIVDAGELNAAPGTIRVFRGDEIEQQMSGRKRTVHEVAISDLLSAATLRGTCPLDCALVAIQPSSVELGLEPTSAVRAAIPAACVTVKELTRRYQDEA